MQVLFPKFMPGHSKQKKKATKKLIELVRALGRTEEGHRGLRPRSRRGGVDGT